MPFARRTIKEMEKVDARGLEHRFEERLRSGPSSLGATEVLDRVLEAAGDVRNLRTLDVGCGTGDLCRRLTDRGASVVGVDVCSNLLARARVAAPGASLLQADALELPFGSRQFDLATSVLVFHYLEEPQLGLREIGRTLRPGARLVVCDRVCSSDPVLQAAQIGVERLRNPLIHRILPSEELEECLRKTGFEVVRQVEFRRSEPLEFWLAGTDVPRAREVREEVGRLRGRDLGGLRVAPGDRIELRMALVESRFAGF